MPEPVPVFTPCGRLMPTPLWAALLDAPDVARVAAVLQQSWYSATLRDLPAAQIDGVQLERALTRQWVAAAQRPTALLQGASRTLMNWYGRRWELNNLKTILRTSPSRRAGTIFARADPARGNQQLAVEHTGRGRFDRRTGRTAPAHLVWQGLTAGTRRISTTTVGLCARSRVDLAYYRQLRNCVTALHGRDRRRPIS
ncbi:MAG: V-type ATPase subunit [Caldilineaceae bacterium]